MSMYSDSTARRAMKIQEIILRAMSGEINWIKAAWIIGVSDRSMRRWKIRYEKYGYDGLFDRRRQRPSPKRVVNKDNTVRYDNKILQIQRQPLRHTCSGLHVLVRHHLDDSYSVWKGPHLLGRFDSSGSILEQLRKKAA